MPIRDEVPADHPAVAALIAAAFGRDDEARLVDRLRNGGDIEVALVAEHDGRLVGHVVLSRMTAPPRTLGLAPVAVLPDLQGRGIGSTLIEAALARAAADDWAAVFVLGDPRYYGRFGFDAALAAPYASPYAGPHLMALALPGSAMPEGDRAAYAPAFDG